MNTKVLIIGALLVACAETTAPAPSPYEAEQARRARIQKEWDDDARQLAAARGTAYVATPPPPVAAVTATASVAPAASISTAPIVDAGAPTIVLHPNEVCTSAHKPRPGHYVEGTLETKTSPAGVLVYRYRGGCDNDPEQDPSLIDQNALRAANEREMYEHGDKCARERLNWMHFKDDPNHRLDEARTRQELADCEGRR